MKRLTPLCWLSGLAVCLVAIFTLQASVRKLRADVARLEKVPHIATVSEREPLNSRISSTPVDSATRPSKDAEAPGQVVIANVGRATPRETLATVTWALQAGNVDLVASAIALNPRSRNEVESFMRTLPEHLQSEYRTPERLIGTLFMSGQLLSTVRILSREEIGADLVSQRIEYEFTGETARRQEELVFQKGADGWRWLIPEGLVARTLGIFRQRAPNSERSASQQPTPDAG